VFLHATGASAGMWEQHLQRLGGYHCLAPDLPGHGRSNRLPWRSRRDTAEQVAELIQRRVPARRAHLVGLSLGGAVAHTLLATRQELLDRVVIDGCGALSAWWIGPMKLGVAAVSPVVHRGPVIGLFARMVGVASSGRDRFTADMQAVSPRAFRRAFADGNGARISSQEVSAPCPTLLVAGEREAKAVRTSNAALAALMPNAVARFAPGRGHGWLAVEPELHCQPAAGQVGQCGAAAEVSGALGTSLNRHSVTHNGFSRGRRGTPGSGRPPSRAWPGSGRR
jgi:pimeloyl-ACP methyl ester carboxylesterase